ncbi:sodium channel protein Nach-like [Pogonomyrmex barbatus]|uniref:Sodium channel protein Nach-like n=1 Tax=Pogonomyrmex barbatus TaxID=144034 RepID=A0A8N1S619_9HYME|nr:sodium channel protein Nach-like [Pogonomyrmex barbatus]
MTLIEFVKALRPCEDLFEICMWDDVVQDCNQLFKMSYTFAGICCSFNYVLEDYIESGRPVDYDKLRTSSLFGPRSGITIVLNRDFLVEDVPEEEKYVKYSTNSVGVVMFPHHPLEYVATLATRIILQKNQELRVSITPFVKKKLSGYYEENSRGEIVPHCADEKITLQYFPSYRYSNCFTSCSINAFLQYCDCIPHYFTPIANKYSLRMCDWEDFACLYRNAKYTRIIQNTLTENYTCECITPCWDVEYELSTSYSELSGNHDFNVAHLYTFMQMTTIPIADELYLLVFMKSSTFMQMTTIPIADELYLLASLGGIFSLFLGCSFISAIEIIYFVGLYFRSSYKKSK